MRDHRSGLRNSNVENYVRKRTKSAKVILVRLSLCSFAIAWTLDGSCMNFIPVAILRIRAPDPPFLVLLRKLAQDLYETGSVSDPDRYTWKQVSRTLSRIQGLSTAQIGCPLCAEHGDIYCAFYAQR